jgi:hypothetical protein
MANTLLCGKLISPPSILLSPKCVSDFVVLSANVQKAYPTLESIVTYDLEC